MVELHPQLVETLRRHRARRGFDARAYVEAKVRLLNDYLRAGGVKGCVVGVSGGIDSAVVLGLCAEAAGRVESPIERVLGALMPMHREGATTQDRATTRGRAVIEHFGTESAHVDLSVPLDAARASVEAGYGKPGGAWAAGQLVSYLRTPALYALTALMTEDGSLSVLVGTTNRDEGSYLGFFGKASDGMVDLQPIGDLHKSEVRAVARLLEVPGEVIDAVPTGDTFDGLVDEEMIGAPYDFVELFGLMRAAGQESDPRWGDEARAQWDELSAKLERLHRKNAHKYIGKSPAVHLDVLDSAVPGGWPVDDRPLSLGSGSRRGGLVGEFELKLRLSQGHDAAARRPIKDFGQSAYVVDGLISDDERAQLLAAFERAEHVQAGVDGRPGGTGGSERASALSPQLAQTLSERLAPLVDAIRITDRYTSTDHEGHAVWRFSGVNDCFRFMSYARGARLLRHTDSTFDLGDGRRRTLMSVLLSLQGPCSPAPPTEGPSVAGARRQGVGATRLLLDEQRHLPVADRDLDDRDVRSPALATPALGAGDALVMDHRLPHDALAWDHDEPRILVRFDLVYERCGVPLLADEPEPVEVPAKVARDPFYGEVFRALGSLASTDHAGWFDDGGSDRPPLDPRANAAWFATPMAKCAARLALAEPEQDLVVLLTTGAFCPIHLGHLQMMEAARRRVEQDGAFVLGGYLSPGHDKYLRQKWPGAPEAARRVHLCELATKDSGWLMTDPWEAEHTNRALNFTEVIAHLEASLARRLHTHRRVRVVYVFGGDNARFALTFVGHGHAVCVPRPGHDEPVSKTRAHPLVAKNPRVIFCDEQIEDVSSSAIREGDERAEDAAIPEAARAAYRAWRDPPPANSTRLFIRDEGDWSIAAWPQLTPKLDGLRDALKGALQSAYDGGLELSVIHLDKQRQAAAERTGGAAVISLDPCLPGDHNVAVSRCFGAADRTAWARLIARPGAAPIDEQAAAIPAGRYVLFDDDKASGYTLRTIRERMPSAVEIDREVTLCDLKEIEADGHVDLADLRDFILGSREGGLVVDLGGLVARAPLALPYVSPHARIGVPLETERRFSRAVWAFNAAFFEGSGLALRDADAAVRSLCRAAGFDDDALLEDIARWHLERLP